MQATDQKHRGLLGSVNCLDLELGADLRARSETERALGTCFGRAYLGKRGIEVGFGHGSTWTQALAILILPDSVTVDP